MKPQAALDAEREKVAQLSEENNNLVVELAELRETVTDLKCSFHGRLSTAQTHLTQLQTLVRGYLKAKDEADNTSEDRDYREFDAKHKTLCAAEERLIASLDPAPVVGALWIRGSDVRDVGWYWWNHKGEMRAVQIAAVRSCEKQYDNKLYAKGGISVPINALDIKDGRWLGPLSIPPVPKGGGGE